MRKSLYTLYANNINVKLVDLGNITGGHSITDTYFAVASAVAELLKKKIIPIIIGGSQDLTYANYMAYQQLEQTINVVAIDPRFDISDSTDQFDSRSYLSKIILSQPNFLFNFSNLGHQSYYVDEEKLDLMSKLYFDVHRLGEVQHDKKEIEPVLRNADMVSFDVSCIRQSDAPGTAHPAPNGLYGEEACQITRYAGMSDKLTSIGFYELNPSYDRERQTTNLVAQLIWYFMEGFSNRKGDFPAGEIKHYTKYHVTLEGQSDELIFYKSDKSERWWMDVPYPSSKKMRFDRHHLVPCTYKDYEFALDGNLPDRWWKSYQKLT